MESNNLNQAPMIAMNPPRVIYVKEYKSDSAYQDTSSRTTCSEPQDERILVSPLNLADNISERSYPISISIQDNAPGLINRNSSIIKHIIEVIDRNSLRFVWVVFLCVLSFLSLALIPYHNVILCPFYWYEAIFTSAFGALPSCICLIVVQVEMIMDMVFRPGI